MVSEPPAARAGRRSGNSDDTPRTERGGVPAAAIRGFGGRRALRAAVESAISRGRPREVGLGVAVRVTFDVGLGVAVRVDVAVTTVRTSAREGTAFLSGLARVMGRPHDLAR
jgi:hypothetical protein